MPWEDLDEEIGEMFSGLSSHDGDRPISFQERESIGLSYFSRSLPQPGRRLRRAARVATDRPCAACGRPLGHILAAHRDWHRHCSRECWLNSPLHPKSPAWWHPRSKPQPTTKLPVLDILTASPRDADEHWPAFSTRVYPLIARPGIRVVRVVLAVGPSPAPALRDAVGSSVHAVSLTGERLQAAPRPAKGVARVAVLWNRRHMEACCTALPTDALEYWKT